MSDDVDAIRTAYERSLTAGPARISYGTETHWQLPQMPEPPQRNAAQQAVLGIGKTAAKAVGKGFLRFVAHQDDPWSRQADGYADLAGRRMMIDYGSYAALQIGDEEWTGRSGRRLSTLPSQKVRVSSPLWLLELLPGVDHATRLEPEQSEQDARGDDHPDWSGFSATASLPAAIAVHGRSMSSPAKDRYEDLLAIAIDVWIDDDGLVRRIRITDDSRMNHERSTLTLREFGVEVDHLDWTRLPTFRSPEEAWKVSEHARDHSS